MNISYRDRRKTDPARGDRLADNTPNDADRIEIGPTLLAMREWDAAGLAPPDLQALRRYRWERLTHHVVSRDLGGLLLFDPMNIRYATDSTNMQLWNSHNPFRAVLLCADGHMVIWDYKNSPFLSSFNPLVREVRSGASMFHFANGDRVEDAAAAFAGEVAEVMRVHAGRNRRLAIDKIMVVGYRALVARGFDISEGEEVTERARSVKGPDEVRAMRCAQHACETSVRVMEEFARVNAGHVSEDEIWSVLHAENIRRGGEWIETRLLTSGPRTNPWFQECGPRILEQNEILAFDTDLIGSYGICIDISRTWWIGDAPARPDMIEAMRLAREHIDHNMALLRPGAFIPDVIAKLHVLPDEYLDLRYSVAVHGVGLCDEWPILTYPDTYVPGSFEHHIEPGMTLCVEALVGKVGGDFMIKLEDQVLVTEDGVENLTHYPFDPRLMGTA